MQKRFIVLVDLSEYSANLIRYAYDWSRQNDAKLLLLHHTPVLVPALADNESRVRIAQLANNTAFAELRELVQRILPPQADVQYLVSETSLALTLPNLLMEPYDNLLFVGIKGTGILKKIFLGSVAIQVIEDANNLVVAIPKTVSVCALRKVYVAVSNKYVLNTRGLEQLLRFIEQEPVELVFFYISDTDEDKTVIQTHLQELVDIFGERYIASYQVHQGTNVFEDVKKVINQHTEELLVVQKGSRLITDQLFRNFLVNELVYEGQTPLAILP